MGAGYSMRAKAEEADIYIYEDVGSGWFGGVSASQFATDLKGLGAVTVINLHINSFGGEVFEGMAIYRQLADHPARVVAHIDGVAASIASVIAMAADEILITQSGFVMVHEASGVAIGMADDMRKMADLLDTISGAIVDVYVARTGRTEEEVRALMEGETWMTAEDAVANGFATSVVENLRVAAYHGDLKRHGFQHAPDALAQASAAAAAAANPAVRPAAEVISAAAALALPPPAKAAPAHAQLAARIQRQQAQLATAHAMRAPSAA